MKTTLLATALLLGLSTASLAHKGSKSNDSYKKTVSILGDSYSTFEDYLLPDSNAVWYVNGKIDRTDVTDVEQTWWHRFIKNQGMRLEVNNSFSGATICYTGYDGKNYENRSFCNRLKYLGSPDIIFVFGATNDDWAKSPVGDFKYEDWTKQDLFSFRPAMAYMLSRLTKRYPNVDIYFIMNCDLRDDITSSCQEICRHYGVDCINLHGIKKINGHPSIEGMKQIEEQIATYINQKKK